MKTVSENRSFGGVQGVYTHASEACGCDMTFGLYMPEIAEFAPVPLIWYLSGLTCTHENAMTKAAAQGWCAENGVAMVFPDTSPRGEDVANDDAFDLGQGAGFYVDATETPWAPHFKMWSYITDELPRVLGESFKLDMDRQSITGHSMGGHGALTIGMAFPERFRAISAFAPIAHPTQSDWGKKQLGAYLGSDQAAWAKHDATLVMREQGFDGPVLIDQGTDDQFLDLLMPEALAEAMAARRQEGHFRLSAATTIPISSCRASWKTMCASMRRRCTGERALRRRGCLPGPCGSGAGGGAAWRGAEGGLERRASALAAPAGRACNRGFRRRRGRQVDRGARGQGRCGHHRRRAIGRALCRGGRTGSAP